jgi:hypothetical protein
MKKIILVLFLSFGFLSCNFSGNITYENEVSEKEDAESVTAMFYLFLSRDDFENTIGSISNSFYKVSSKEDLLYFLKSKREKLGAFKDYDLIEWKTSRVEGTDKKNLYLLTYRVKYEKEETIETIKLIKENNEIKIYGYNVDN